MAIEILARIEKDFNIEIQENLLFNITTVGEFIDIILILGNIKNSNKS